MAVTATATLVQTLTADPARPAGHAGWNNPYGDPAWIADIDWYRRVQLVCTGSAGEVGTTVNWECIDPTLPMKTNADLATAKAGSVASPYGATINNSDTWTVWVTTGVATATADKYTDTKTPVISTLRANGPRVQVLLGSAKKFGAADTIWTIAAFLPGAGKIPSAQATVTVKQPYANLQALITALQEELEDREDDTPDNTLPPEGEEPPPPSKQGRKRGR